MSKFTHPFFAQSFLGLEDFHMTNINFLFANITKFYYDSFGKYYNIF
jgi:hypothetical protein